jgi:hypothetical protein
MQEQWNSTLKIEIGLRGGHDELEKKIIELYKKLFVPDPDNTPKQGKRPTYEGYFKGPSSILEFEKSLISAGVIDDKGNFIGLSENKTREIKGIVYILYENEFLNKPVIEIDTFYLYYNSINRSTSHH